MNKKRKYFKTKEEAWKFAWELSKKIYQLTDFGINKKSDKPYYIEYIKV